MIGLSLINNGVIRIDKVVMTFGTTCRYNNAPSVEVAAHNVLILSLIIRGILVDFEVEAP
jgi:hypothetical protein